MVRYYAKDILRDARGLIPGTTTVEVGVREDNGGDTTPDVRRWKEDVDLDDVLPLGKCLRRHPPAAGEVWDLYCYGRYRGEPCLLGNLDLVFPESGPGAVRDPFDSGEYVPSPGVPPESHSETTGGQEPTS